MKKIHKLLITAIGFLTLTGCQYIGGNVSRIELNQKEITLEQGDSYQLDVATYPATANSVELKWTIAPGKNATVKDGLVTAKDNLNITKYVTETVKVQSAKFKEVYDTCTVYIKPKVIIPLESINFEKSVNEVSLNNSISLDVNYFPTNASDKRVNYEITDTTIASVENNNNSALIKGLKVGSTTLKATSYEGGFIATTTINVIEVKATSISLNKTSALVYKGMTETLKATIEPSNVSDDSVIWTSSNIEIATVNNGVITAKNVGSAVIKASTNDGLVSATCNITVEEFKGTPKTKLKSIYSDYSNNNVYELDHCPSTGDSKLLIIPIWFTDSKNYIATNKKESVLEDIKTAYVGTPEETGWHSVKSYYAEESQNRLNLNAVVTDWYECGKATSYYASEQSSNPENSGQKRTNALVKTASDWYFNQSGSDSRKSFDTDGNGYLDGVMLIYAAPDYNAKNYIGDSGNLWAYCFWLQNDSYKSTSKPGPNVFFWASYDFMYGETNALNRTGKLYHSGDTRNCKIDAHTYIHEMGHVFGLDDYYDYNSGKTNPAGGFNMQDHNVGGHDPYSIMALGWADPYIPTNTDTITLRPFESSHDLILLTPEFNEYLSPFDEYLLLEFYTPSGLNEFDTKYRYCEASPKGVSKSGIRLWHVDARLLYPYGNTFTDKNITSNPNHSLGVTHMMANTSWSSGAEDYCSPLGEKYAKYNLLQMIRKNRSLSYTTDMNFAAEDLFVDGDEFDPGLYTAQFQNSTKLNSGKYLNWTFSVSISGSGDGQIARVTCTKKEIVFENLTWNLHTF